MPAQTRLLLLFGGVSSEHEVSVRSAASILAAVDRQIYHPILVGIRRDGTWHTGEPDQPLAEIIAHGPLVADLRALAADVVFPTPPFWLTTASTKGVEAMSSDPDRGATGGGGGRVAPLERGCFVGASGLAPTRFLTQLGSSATGEEAGARFRAYSAGRRTSQRRRRIPDPGTRYSRGSIGRS